MKFLNCRNGLAWLAIPCFLSILIHSTSLAEDRFQEKIESIPWSQRSWEHKTVGSSYEDEFTNTHNVLFSKDPFVWALSKEFAGRFGMPKEWIDPELKGALAVAWRTTSIGQVTCGYGGNPNVCWPSFTCQMDIYVEIDAPIPWRFSDVQRDFFWTGLSSLDFVPRRMPDPRRSRYSFSEGTLGSKGLPFYTEGLRSKTKLYTANDGSVFAHLFRSCIRTGSDPFGLQLRVPRSERERRRSPALLYAGRANPNAGKHSKLCPCGRIFTRLHGKDWRHLCDRKRKAERAECRLSAGHEKIRP